MKFVGALLCLAIASVAVKQNKAPIQCKCNELDSCVEQDVEAMASKAETCGQMCTPYLVKGGDKALQCLVDKVTSVCQAMEEAQVCVEGILGRPCKVDAGNSTRPKRSLSPFIIGAPVFGKPGPKQSSSGSHEGGPGSEFESKSVKLGGSAKNDLFAFGFCFHNCMSNGTAAPMKDMKKHHEEPYGECPKQLKCTLPKPRPPTGPQGKLLDLCQKKNETVSQTFCNCMQNIYGADVTCKF